jgi:hypothetical protein
MILFFSRPAGTGINRCFSVQSQEVCKKRTESFAKKNITPNFAVAIEKPTP